MDVNAHWLRLHHGTYADPKWRIVVTRCHAKSHHVTTAEVLAVWMCMLETASQAKPRGTLEGWCHEDVAAALGLAEDRVAAIYDAMQGKTLDGNKLLAWDRRQPKREREDQTAAERKRAQRDREAAERAAAAAAGRGVTWRDTGQSRHVTHRGEESRGEEKHSTTSRSVDTSERANCARAQDDFGGHDRDQVPDTGRAFELLDEHDQDLVRPLLDRLKLAKPSLTLLVQFLAQAVDAGAKRTAGWYDLLRLQLDGIAADGHSVDDQLRETIDAGDRTEILMPVPATNLHPPEQPTLAGQACRAMRDAGIQHTNSAHPKLLAALAGGVTVQQLRATAIEAVERNNPSFTWCIATAHGRLRDAGSTPPSRAGPQGKTSGIAQNFEDVDYG